MNRLPDRSFWSKVTGTRPRVTTSERHLYAGVRTAEACDICSVTGFYELARWHLYLPSEETGFGRQMCPRSHRTYYRAGLNICLTPRPMLIPQMLEGYTALTSPPERDSKVGRQENRKQESAGPAGKAGGLYN